MNTTANTTTNDERLAQALSDLSAARDALEMVIHGKDPEFANATRVFNGIRSGGLASFVGKFVIVRTRHAGIWAGVVESNRGWSVVLTQARRMWMWMGITVVNGRINPGLSGVALNGVDPAKSEIHAPIDRVWIDGIEVLSVTDKARASIEATTPEPKKLV